MKFELELSYIKNSVIRRIATDIVNLIPEYFYTIPASSTGKYHPKFALGDGGLYRHVQAAVVIARELFNNNQFRFSPDDQDLIIASLIGHDGWKQGEIASGRTTHEHPITASKVISENVVSEDIDERIFIETICANIESHMGQWNIDERSAVTLPLPQGKMQNFVHLVDYLASRKVVEIVL